jgi:hypothetical protein
MLAKDGRLANPFRDGHGDLPGAVEVVPRIPGKHMHVVVPDLLVPGSLVVLSRGCSRTTIG